MDLVIGAVFVKWVRQLVQSLQKEFSNTEISSVTSTAVNGYNNTGTVGMKRVQ